MPSRRLRRLRQHQQQPLISSGMLSASHTNPTGPIAATHRRTSSSGDNSTRGTAVPCPCNGRSRNAPSCTALIGCDCATSSRRHHAPPPPPCCCCFSKKYRYSEMRSTAGSRPPRLALSAEVSSNAETEGLPSAMRLNRLLNHSPSAPSAANHICMMRIPSRHGSVRVLTQTRTSNEQRATSTSISSSSRGGGGGGDSSKLF
jgi:hypothetical protein